jgi:hypothetical protein
MHIEYLMMILHGRNLFKETTAMMTTQLTTNQEQDKMLLLQEWASE